eukprot:11461770-Alexandrium_andersonii.AAC.1
MASAVAAGCESELANSARHCLASSTGVRGAVPSMGVSSSARGAASMPCLAQSCKEGSATVRGVQ